MRAKAAEIPVISCMGAGNKLDASAFQVADIYKTKMCPLAKVMRKKNKGTWRKETESCIFRRKAGTSAGRYEYQLQKTEHLYGGNGQKMYRKRTCREALHLFRRLQD